jgi:hypothetical protein
MHQRNQVLQVPEMLSKNTLLLSHSKMLTASSSQIPTQLFPEILLKRSGLNIKINHAPLVLPSRLAASQELQILIQESVFMLVLMTHIPSSTNFSTKLLKSITDMAQKPSMFLT